MVSKLRSVDLILRIEFQMPASVDFSRTRKVPFIANPEIETSSRDFVEPRE